MNIKSSSDLREARKARLAATTKKAEETTSPVATDKPAELPMGDGAVEKTVCSKCGMVMDKGAPMCAACMAAEAAAVPAPPSGDMPAPAAVEPAPEAAPAMAEEMTAKVVDPSKLGVGSKITIAGPYNQNTNNPHWVAFADGEPLAKIALADQDKPEEMRKVFATEGYARSFVDTASKVSLTQLLATVRARPYIASVKSTEVFASVDNQYKAAAKAEFQKVASQYRDEFLTMMNLVSEAQRKNFVNSNPLKDALFTAMKTAGVENPVSLIEAAFAEAGPAHFEGMCKLAAKWMDYNPEALADIKQTITDMAHRTPVVASTNTIPSANKPVPSSRANVHFTTTSAPETRVAAAGNEKDALRSTFSFSDRMRGGAMRGK